MCSATHHSATEGTALIPPVASSEEIQIMGEPQPTSDADIETLLKLLTNIVRCIVSEQTQPVDLSINQKAS